jgi:hypothetical protein
MKRTKQPSVPSTKNSVLTFPIATPTCNNEYAINMELVSYSIR